MAQFWVIGGQYKDTSFRELEAGAREERHGPFATYEDAYKAWSGRTRATVDSATMRFRIISDDAPAS